MVTPETQPLKMQIRLAFVAGDLATAATLIVDTIVRAGGNQVDASYEIGCMDRQLRRWTTRLLERGFDVRELTKAKGVVMLGPGGANAARKRPEEALGPAQPEFGSRRRPAKKKRRNAA